MARWLKYYWHDIRKASLSLLCNLEEKFSLMMWGDFFFNNITTDIVFFKYRQYSEVFHKTLEVQLLSFGKLLDVD